MVNFKVLHITCVTLKPFEKRCIHVSINDLIWLLNFADVTLPLHLNIIVV